MKIRNGYVSNSSSSSFLVIFRDIDEFSKFEKFNGYAVLIDDLKKKCDTDVKSFIIRYATDYFNRLTDCYDERRLSNCGFSPWDIMDMLHERTGMEFDDGLKSRSIERKILDRKWELKNGGMQNWDAEERLRKEFHNDYTAMCLDIADAVSNALCGSDMEFCIVEYDDCHDYYMEHYFMPFVSRSPDDDFVVISKSNH